MTRAEREFSRAPDAPFPAMLQSGPVGPARAYLRSSQLKDIGRTHNGMLYCSAFLGRLKKPYVGGIPILLLADGTQIYADVTLVIASMGGDHGTVVESGDLDAILSPNAFDHWNRPHVSYMIVAVDRKTNKMTRIAGPNLNLQTSQVLSQGFAILAGRIYRGSCSERNQICAVTSESLAAPLLPQTVAMAESLGVEVIVEAVETEVQRKFLSASQKPLRLQGWYFSKALSAEGLRLILKKNDVLSETGQANPIQRYKPEAAVLFALHNPQA